MNRKRSQRTGDKAGKSSEAVVKSYASAFSQRSDPLGSYTGRSQERGEKPEQDADDL